MARRHYLMIIFFLNITSLFQESSLYSFHVRGAFIIRTGNPFYSLPSIEKDMPPSPYSHLCRPSDH